MDLIRSVSRDISPENDNQLNGTCKDCDYHDQNVTPTIQPNADLTNRLINYDKKIQLQKSEIEKLSTELSATVISHCRINFLLFYKFNKFAFSSHKQKSKHDEISLANAMLQEHLEAIKELHKANSTDYIPKCEVNRIAFYRNA